MIEQSQRPTRDPRLNQLTTATTLIEQGRDAATAAAVRRTSPIAMHADKQTPREVVDTPHRAIAIGQQQRTDALRAFGMPDAVQLDPAGKFINTNEKKSFWEQVARVGRSTREHVIWESRDGSGRLHAETGPAAVTNKGSLLFFQEGRMTPGPDGFAAITADGRGYRGVDAAEAAMGRVLKRLEAPERVTAKRRSGAEIEL